MLDTQTENSDKLMLGTAYCLLQIRLFNHQWDQKPEDEEGDVEDGD